MKRVIGLLIGFMLLCSVACADVVDFVYSFENHILTLYGTHPDGVGAEVTMLVTKAGFDPENPDISGILYVDQVTTGINGGFVRNMHLGVIDEAVEIKVGGSGNVGVAIEQVHLTSAPLGVGDVADNSVKIGNDVYEMNGIHLTPNNIADSLRDGGNFMEFKIAGMWFNLLDDSAYQSDYFTPKNSILGDVVNSWELKKWYRLGSAYPLLFN